MVMESIMQLKTVASQREKQSMFWIDPLTTEERVLISTACRLSRLRRPAFYKDAILSYCAQILNEHQASLAPASPSPEQEAGEASLS